MEDEAKKCRVIHIEDKTYQVLCMADKTSFDPSQGARNLALMYESLAGPLDFETLAKELAKKKAKQWDLW